MPLVKAGAGRSHLERPVAGDGCSNTCTERNQRTGAIAWNWSDALRAQHNAWIPQIHALELDMADGQAENRLEN